MRIVMKADLGRGPGVSWDKESRAYTCLATSIKFHSLTSDRHNCDPWNNGTDALVY